jgi:protein-tyrosine phosphatase
MVAEEPTRLSPSTAERLKSLGIPLALTAPEPIQLTQGDLVRAHRAVALRRDEHRALMSLQHPEWADQIEYWDVRDIDELEAELALPRIETQVEELLKLYA